MNKTIVLVGSILGGLAVVFGAFGAHGLQKVVGPEAVETFNTGVEYQVYHALFLLVLGTMRQLPESRKKLVFLLIAIGVVLFSFSIYLLALNSLYAYDFKNIGLITPLGGTLMILGWCVFGYRSFKYYS